MINNSFLADVLLPCKLTSFKAAGILNQVAKGNLEYRVVGEFVGDHAIIKNSLNQTIDKLQGLITDTNALAEAAAEGRLSFRADAEKHEGANAPAEITTGDIPQNRGNFMDIVFQC